MFKCQLRTSETVLMYGPATQDIIVVRAGDGALGGDVLVAIVHGLTPVHFSAQLERFVWERGCAQGLCSPLQGGARGCFGCGGCFLVTDKAQVELRSGRV
jgi:hypothetical protein